MSSKRTRGKATAEVTTTIRESQPLRKTRGKIQPESPGKGETVGLEDDEDQENLPPARHAAKRARHSTPAPPSSSTDAAPTHHDYSQLLQPIRSVSFFRVFLISPIIPTLFSF